MANQRPNLVKLADQIYTHDINQWANPAAFSLPAPGTLGNLQRDFLTGPHTVNMDYDAIQEIRTALPDLRARRNAWDQRHQIREVAPVQRQIVDLL